MAEENNRTRVLILTATYRIKGSVTLVPGARLTDYFVEAKEFIAVTDAEVWEREGRLVMNAPFINVRRDHIEVVAPA